MNAKKFSNFSSEDTSLLLTPKPCEQESSYPKPDNDPPFILKEKNNNLRDSDENPLDSIKSLGHFMNQIHFDPKDFNQEALEVLRTEPSDRTFIDSRDAIEDYPINDIHLFDKEDSLNLGKISVFPIYQKKHWECHPKPNHRMRRPIVSEFVLTLDEKGSKNLSESRNALHFSENLSHILNAKIIESSSSLFEDEQQRINTEESLLRNHQVGSFVSSFSFDFSGSLNNLLVSFNHSLTNSSLISCGSEKENTPPLVKDQIKAYALDTSDSMNKKTNFILKYNLGINGLCQNDLTKSENVEIPLTLTLENDFYKTKNNDFSLDLIIILCMKKSDTKDSMDFFRRKIILNIFEYIFSILNENDRFGLIRLGAKEKNESVVFLQKLSSLSKSMKKLMIQFLSFEPFSNENVNVFAGLEAGLEILSQRSYRNNYTSILIISDLIFDFNCSVLSDTQIEIKKLQKKLDDLSFVGDHCFNINSIYCGCNPNEIIILEDICVSNRGYFYKANNLTKLKVYDHLNYNILKVFFRKLL